MSAASPRCLVVMYHYVKEPGRCEFPGLNGLTKEAFQAQLDFLSSSCEMATLESALAFWRGDYQPRRDLCLLTFDDGLADHYRSVTPLLAERGLQGLFFLITGCLAENALTLVHQSHLLMAELGFDAYRRAAEDWLGRRGLPLTPQAPPEAIARTYRWDQPAVKAFKYLINFEMAPSLRAEMFTDIFHRHLGRQEDFARRLFLDWEQARQMQAAGMVMGGHSHRHPQLASLPAAEVDRELAQCASALHANLLPQEQWPFSYPHGKADTFNADTRRALANECFVCGLSSIPGATRPGADIFSLQRIDASSVDAQAGVVTC